MIDDWEEEDEETFKGVEGIEGDEGELNEDRDRKVDDEEDEEDEPGSEYFSTSSVSFGVTFPLFPFRLNIRGILGGDG